MAEFAENLPGAELVNSGLIDLRRGEITNAALLLAICAPRLRSLGVKLPNDDLLPRHAEHQLFSRLEIANAREAHSNYNALIRRLVSFERALEQRNRRTVRT